MVINKSDFISYIMDEIEQARQGLLIYLQANRTYIEQKVYNEFNVECIQNKTLQTLDIAKMKKTIKQIFDFGDNKVYQYFFQQLQANIKKYIQEQYKAKAIASYYVLDIEKLTQIIKYCILHGFDENARHAKKQQKKQAPKQIEKEKEKPKQKQKQKPKQKPKVIFVEEQKKIQPPKDQFAHIKKKVSTFLQKDKIPQKRQFKIQKYSMPEIKAEPKISTFLQRDKIPQKRQFKLERYSMPEIKSVQTRISTFLQRDKIPQKKQFKLQRYSMPDNTNVLPRYLASIKPVVVKQEQQQPRIIVSPLDDNYINNNRRILRERLEKLFNFYCYQQQSLGQCPSFDRIKDQGQLMNLGKFMQFCQYTRLFQCKQITKDALMAEFKRTSQGKIQIQFEIFEKIINNLDKKYLQVMAHDSINNPIPTFQARLLLNEPNKLGELKKHRHLIFGTRSKQGREAKEFTDTIIKKELTGHSGRFVNDLSLDLKDKNEPKISKSAQKATKPKNSQTTIHLTQLKKLRLPKISWIVDQQDQFLQKQLKK